MAALKSLKDITDSFEEQLTCSLCLDVFTDPKSLPCLHSFCTRCIAQWFRTSGNPFNNQMDCPMCKTTIVVPDGDPTKFRPSFYIDSLLQLLHAMKRKADQPELPHCVKCEHAQVLVAFCSQCNGLMCEACFNAHKLFKEVQDEHQPIMLDQFKEENVNSFIKNQMVCEEKFHEKKKLKYYCETCVRCICQKCATLGHENHQKKSLEDAGQDAEKWILTQMNRVEQRLEKCGQELEQSKENMARIEREIDAAAKDVEDVVGMICDKAKEHGRAMKDELTHTLQELTTANIEEQNDIKSRIKHLLEYKNHCEALTSRNVACDMIQSKELLQQGCQMLSDIPSIWYIKPIERDTRVRYQANPQSLQLLQDIGKTEKIVTAPENSTIESLKEVRCGFLDEFNIITRSLEEELCSTRIESIDVRIKDVEGNEVEKKVSEEQTGKYRVSFKPQKTGPHEIQVNIGGKGAKNSPQNVDILDVKEEFKPLKIFERSREEEIEVLDEPKSVSHSDTGEIAIVNRKDHRIEIFSLLGNYLREFGSQGIGEGQLYYPFGVVFNEDRIIVSDGPDGKGRIQEFDLNGTYVRTIYRPDQWFEPCGMCVNDDKNIAVCCRGKQELGIKPSIKVFSKQGDLVHDFDMPDKNEQPVHITYGNGKYFVSYSDKNYVRVFDVNGVFLYKFGEEGARDGQLNGACGLAVYGPDMILACDYKNNCVKFFTQDGEFVSSFGHFGSGFCQMVCPTDLTITADGHVFVLECMNNRVQVWY